MIETRSSDKRASGLPSKQKSIHLDSLGGGLQANAEPPRLELHASASRRPGRMRTLKKAGVSVELDRAVLMADDDPRLVAVVLRDREALLAHEHVSVPRSRTGETRR